MLSLQKSTRGVAYIPSRFFRKLVSDYPDTAAGDGSPAAAAHIPVPPHYKLSICCTSKWFVFLLLRQSIPVHIGQVQHTRVQRIAELREMPQSFIIKLYSETLGMSGSISPRHAQNPLSLQQSKEPIPVHIGQV